MYSMTVTWPIITKLTFEQQLFAKNSYTKFHENLTDHLVTDTRWMDMWVVMVYFYFIKNI